MFQGLVRSDVTFRLVAAPAAIVLVLSSASPVRAGDVSVGGSHDQVLVDAQRSLAGAEGGRGVALGSLQITVGSGETSALTRFTPRFAGVGRPSAGSTDANADRFAPATDQLERAPQELRIAPESAADIAGFGVGWSARAALQSDDSNTLSPSALAVGGELAVSGLKLDASYGAASSALVDPEGLGMSAGVGYEFGTLATRMGYSLVERDTPSETSVFTLGSQLAVHPGLVVSGDLEYADETEGDSATAGVVSFKFSF
jgi:hypothetical protein